MIYVKEFFNDTRFSFIGVVLMGLTGLAYQSLGYSLESLIWPVCVILVLAVLSLLRRERPAGLALVAITFVVAYFSLFGWFASVLVGLAFAAIFVWVEVRNWSKTDEGKAASDPEPLI